MRKRYGTVATGGTFDVIHRGHMALLRRSFELGEKVVIGLTGDRLAAELGKKITNDYVRRFANLRKLLDAEFMNNKYEIAELEEDFGPALFTESVEALVTSSETVHKGQVLNKLRAERNLKPVEIVAVELVLAKDGKRISSTRIRNGEIDPEGNLIPRT